VKIFNAAQVKELDCMNKNRRVFGRFATALQAYYISKSDTGDVKHDCMVVNMSRKGFGLEIKADKKINENSDIRLEIYVPEKKSPTYVNGIVKWVEKRGYAWAAGVECLNIIDELEFSKMS
jgi:hypothetical protein